MSALLRAELLRLVSRRLLVLLLVCMAAGAALGAAVDASSARPLSGRDHRVAQEDWAQARADWQDYCGDSAPSQDCTDWVLPSDPDEFLRVPVGFGEYTETVLDFALPLMLLAVALLAASLIGAEFTSGSIGTQLLFTPRRIPLMLAKVVAAALGGLLVSLVYLGSAVAFCAIMFLSLRGAGDMTAGVELPLALGRMVLLGLLIAVITGALAMAVGSALVASGILAVVLVGSTMISDSISGSSVLQPYFPDNILFAMATGQHEIYDWSSDNYWPAQVISYDWAVGYSLVGTMIILAVAAFWFRRRDILR